MVIEHDTAPPTSGETYFFRDHGQIDLLRLRLLPELIERGALQKPCACGAPVEPAARRPIPLPYW